MEKWFAVGPIPVHSLKEISKPVWGWYGGAEQIGPDQWVHLIYTRFGPIKIRGCVDLNIKISKFEINDPVRICFGGETITAHGHVRFIAIVERFAGDTNDLN